MTPTEGVIRNTVRLYKRGSIVLMTSAQSVVLLVAALLVNGCDDGDEGARPATTTPKRPASTTTTTSSSYVGRFFPSLEGYRINDEAPVDDEKAALDDSEVPYADVRRRLLLDEHGFTMGEVLVVTFPPGTGADEKFLRAWFGKAPRQTVEVGDVELVRIRRAHGASDVLTWTGPTFAVVFSRAQEVSDEWLFDLARATVASVRP